MNVYTKLQNMQVFARSQKQPIRDELQSGNTNIAIHRLHRLHACIGTVYSITKKWNVLRIWT